MIAGLAVLIIGFIFFVEPLILVGFLTLVYAGWRTLDADRD